MRCGFALSIPISAAIASKDIHVPTRTGMKTAVNVKRILGIALSFRLILYRNSPNTNYEATRRQRLFALMRFATGSPTEC